MNGDYGSHIILQAPQSFLPHRGMRLGILRGITRDSTYRGPRSVQWGLLAETTMALTNGRVAMAMQTISAKLRALCLTTVMTMMKTC